MHGLDNVGHMKRIKTPGTAVVVLLATILLTGCGAQAEAESGSTPSASASDQSTASATGASGEQTYTGTRSVSLDAPVKEATEVLVSLTCLTPGKLTLSNGAGVECNDGNEGATGTVPLTLSAGQDAFDVTASEDSVEYKVKIAHEAR